MGSINIVSFSIPYPPNYGGAIDIFFKIKTLHALGVKIYLHCFQYDRPKSEELEKYCSEVHYYPRYVGIKNNISFLPFIVKSRKSEKLACNLLQNNYPIIFEGIHTCYLLNDSRFNNRVKIYRESNIEHYYYYHLAKVSKDFQKKLFFLVESFRLRIFQKQLSNSDIMLAVSQKDYNYLAHRFTKNKVHYIPSFHGNSIVSSLTGKGTYILFHGNLSVAENIDAANYLIDNIFSKINTEVIIAGFNPDKSIVRRVLKQKNIKLISNPDDKTMNDLIRQAHINILFTKQATGLKLKLINVLYAGRFVLVNTKMLAGTNLSDLCIIADSINDMISKINNLLNLSFSQDEIIRRQSILNDLYNDEKNGLKIISFIEDTNNQECV